MPDGSSPDQVHAYYDYLYSQYFQNMTVDRTHILWSGPFWTALFAIVLILFFFFLAYYFSSAHRGHGELYGAASFAGSLMERIGPVSLFTRLVIGSTFVWGLYYIVVHIINGQIY